MGGIARVPSNLLDEPRQGDRLVGWRLDRRWSAPQSGVVELAPRKPAECGKNPELILQITAN